MQPHPAQPPALAFPAGAGTPGLSALPYREVWAADFEFQAPDGHRPRPVCMVAKELRSGRTMRLWRDELLAMPRPPFPTDEGALFVAYFNSAEFGCFLELGWPMPERTVDLFAEFRAKTNGQIVFNGNGLIGALAHHGLDTMGTDEKADMRRLIMDRTSLLWTLEERRAILDYCESDVLALERLMPVMVKWILRDGIRSLSAALFRGRYMAAVARIEREGVPIDAGLFGRLNRHWDDIKLRLIHDAAHGGIYTPDGRFSMANFDAFLRENRIPWPRTETGLPETKQNTFRDMAGTHPLLAPLAELRGTLSELKLNKLAVGPDARNRTLLSPFRARSGRNQPSNSKFVFGPAKWIRHLIRAPEGMALAYIDWRSQEIAIAAGLSGDAALVDAYGGDPYLAFAEAASMVPKGATRASHPSEREVAKAVVLGVNYGMGAESLAYRAGIGRSQANALLKVHRRTYAQFWGWSERHVDRGMSGQTILTRLGWPLRVGRGDYNARSLLNHPMQANGSDMMRLACCLATEAGHRICAPVHDALLLIADVDKIHDEARAVGEIMEYAGAKIAGIPVDAEVEPAAFVMPGQRYQEKRGKAMFERVVGLLERIENEAG